MTSRFPFRGLTALTPQSAEVSYFFSGFKPLPEHAWRTRPLLALTRSRQHVLLAKLDEAGKAMFCREQRRSRWLADRIPSSVDFFAHAGARCHATCQHCSRDEAPRHPRRWLVPLLLRVGSSRRATSGTSTAFISNRADPTAWWWLICRVNGAVLAAPSRRQCVAMSRKNNTA